MARIHSHRRGKSHSTRPPSRSHPSWLRFSEDEILAAIVKMAKEGLTPSIVGLRLRDEFGVPSVKALIGRSVSDVFSEHKLAPKMPEDLARLMDRAKDLQSHLATHRGDRKNVRSLELLEAKIHRLSRFYRREGKLPANWKYSAAVAQLL